MTSTFTLRGGAGAGEGKNEMLSEVGGGGEGLVCKFLKK